MRFVWNFRGSCPVLDQSASINVDFHWTRATNSNVFHRWRVNIDLSQFSHSGEICYNLSVIRQFVIEALQNIQKIF